MKTYLSLVVDTGALNRWPVIRLPALRQRPDLSDLPPMPFIQPRIPPRPPDKWYGPRGGRAYPTREAALEAMGDVEVHNTNLPAQRIWDWHFEPLF